MDTRPPPQTLEAKIYSFRTFKQSIIDLWGRVNQLAASARGATKNHDGVSKFFEKYQVQAAELERYGLHQPKLRLIVIGRVKSGKSMLINALLGQYICKTDVTPCTARVCKILYSQGAYLKVGDRVLKKDFVLPQEYAQLVFPYVLNNAIQYRRRSSPPHRASQYVRGDLESC